MMTREDKLYAMKGSELIKEADKLGVKVNCNKVRTQLSESKSKVIERILAAEAEAAKTEETPVVEEVTETQVEETPVETAVEETPIEETQEETEEETIPPFVYTDANGETWEDADLGEMIYKWSDEKKAAFTTYFNEVFMGNGGFETHTNDDLEIWSFQWDADHGTTKEKKEGHKPTPKRGALIEWNGKSQNICKWGEELGISPNTLYGRIYKMGWTVEKAFTTRPR